MAITVFDELFMFAFLRKGRRGKVEKDAPSNYYSMCGQGTKLSDKLQ